MIYLLLFLSGLVAWTISTAAAGGGATLLVPVIGFLLGAQVVPPIISIASVFANPSRVFFFYQYIDWKVIRYLTSGSILGAILGAWLFTQINIELIQIIIGVFLISYVFQYQFSKTKLQIHMQRRWYFPLGVLVSFLSGLVGATGPILNPFMLSYGLEKEQLVATKSLNSLVMQLSKLTTYTIFGALTWQTGIYGILLGAGGIFGVYIARNHLLNIKMERFRNYTMAIMAISGLLMLAKAF
jgi:uncharacterized membrane protein YfcA